ncbi:phosphohydrolase [Erwinia sp. OLTSP20]|uniref:phosphohydrolase n=1 Tax=unclassified Erwinia TaxID=2622719 RepID=UPI000C1892CD|nr:MULTISPECIES: phosphohydrolase [unclassified Erwinia]PIJ48531.1 phosphohydrolase [Erwinia sp. OAMSP11]PIJ69149.1 phosphohydrolase [Erwinia sp. OLSSP12]PIJ78796.1 phosphohydrolase [Erwinia sp. OLCASP19]PIJ81828.1 phosphohydrolase [Erwinia sp. OLMTSP26]PIJ82106.1 phosphohydrolase [Erwinia sp. OLMDSP33]
MSLNDWQQRFENWFNHNWQKEDKAHDVAHLRRVWQTARQIMRTVKADELVVLTGCYFHDLVNLPKNHPQRHLASTFAADQTRQLLRKHFTDFPAEKIEAVVHCVQAHSFSARISAETIEAKIVQDADRLESLGAIGLARTFYVSGALGRALFDPDDPFAAERPLDDLEWALDHFQAKLLRLPLTMQTDEGKRMATFSARFLVTYMAKLSAELQGNYCGIDETILKQFTDE